MTAQIHPAARFASLAGGHLTHAAQIRAARAAINALLLDDLIRLLQGLDDYDQRRISGALKGGE